MSGNFKKVNKITQKSKRCHNQLTLIFIHTNLRYRSYMKITLHHLDYCDHKKVWDGIISFSFLKRSSSVSDLTSSYHGFHLDAIWLFSCGKPLLLKTTRLDPLRQLAKAGGKDGKKCIHSKCIQKISHPR